MMARAKVRVIYDRASDRYGIGTERGTFSDGTHFWIALRGKPLQWHIVSDGSRGTLPLKTSLQLAGNDDIRGGFVDMTGISTP